MKHSMALFTGLLLIVIQFAGGTGSPDDMAFAVYAFIGGVGGAGAIWWRSHRSGETVNARQIAAAAWAGAMLVILVVGSALDLEGGVLPALLGRGIGTSLFFAAGFGFFAYGITGIRAQAPTPRHHGKETGPP